jgi:hypothetical protein
MTRLVLAALLALHAALPDEPRKAPRISVDPQSFDFGHALQNKTLQKEFRVRNFGDANLEIERISTTCGCTAALMESGGNTLKPGESRQMRVTLQTRDFTGRLVRSVLIRSNDPDTAVLEVQVEADVSAGK